MRHPLRLAALLGAVILSTLVLSFGTASAVSIDGYYQQIANELKNDHVYVDKGMLSDSQEKTLEQQVHKTDDPIYVVVTNQPVNKKNAAAFLDGVHVALGPNTTAFLAVGSANGFYATGYNMKSSAIKAAASSATTAARSRNTYTASSSWTDSVSKLSYKKTSPWKPILIVIAVLALVGLILILVLRKRRNNREEAEQNTAEDRLQSRIDALADAFSTLVSDGAELNSKANSELTQMLTNRDLAQQRLNKGDLVDAEKYVKQAEGSKARVRRILDGDTTSPQEAPHYDRSATSSYSGSSYSRPQDDDEPYSPSHGARRSTYTDYSPRQIRSADYPYYSSGVYASNGMWIPAGYYPVGAYSDPFLNAVLVHELLDNDHDHHNGGYGGGDYRDDDDDREVDSGDVGGSDYSDSSDSSFGGRDYSDNSESDDNTDYGGGDYSGSYESPSYDFGSSDNTSYGDVGGGDYDSGSYDSGGDYGGGDFGGGDYS